MGALLSVAGKPMRFRYLQVVAAARSASTAVSAISGADAGPDLMLQR